MRTQLASHRSLFRSTSPSPLRSRTSLPFHRQSDRMLDLDGAISILLRKKLLGEALIKEICEKTKELLMRESNVVHISAPVTVVGDIHGFVPLPLPSLIS